MTFIGFTGLQSFNLVSQIIIYGWIIAYLVVVCLAVASKDKPMLTRALIYFICILVACAFALKTFRSNVLLLPLTFLSYHFVSLLLAIKNRFIIWKYINPIVLGVIILGSVYIYSYASQIYHPDSTYIVVWQGDFLYGCPKAEIPKERLYAVQNVLSRNHINNFAEYQDFLMTFEHSVKNHLPDSNGDLFIPFLTPFANDETNLFLKTIGSLIK